jgi:hypothetical protein
MQGTYLLFSIFFDKDILDIPSDDFAFAFDDGFQHQWFQVFKRSTAGIVGTYQRDRIELAFGRTLTTTDAHVFVDHGCAASQAA